MYESVQNHPFVERDMEASCRRPWVNHNLDGVPQVWYFINEATIIRDGIAHAKAKRERNRGDPRTGLATKVYMM